MLISIKRTLITILSILVFTTAYSNDTTFVKIKKWYMPDYTKVQFAGNIGFLSVGFGYQFFNNRMNSDLLFGFVPASISKAKEINTFTIKNTYSILDKKIGKLVLSPITGITASMETGNNSFLKLAAKYPENYYKTNAIHFTFFVGIKAHKILFNTSTIREVDFFIERGTVGTYLWYAISSKEITIHQVMSTSIGANFYF